MLFHQVHERRVGLVRLFVLELASVDIAAWVLAFGALWAMLRAELGLPKTLAACVISGALWKLV